MRVRLNCFEANKWTVQYPEVFDKVEIYVDGGFRRGTDVLKALCLGATAVGFGRSFLYANAAYGEAGVTKTIKRKQGHGL